MMTKAAVPFALAVMAALSGCAQIAPDLAQRAQAQDAATAYPRLAPLRDLIADLPPEGAPPAGQAEEQALAARSAALRARADALAATPLQ